MSNNSGEKQTFLTSEYKWKYITTNGVPVAEVAHGRDSSGAVWAAKLAGALITIRFNLEALKRKDFYGYEFKFDRVVGSGIVFDRDWLEYKFGLGAITIYKLAKDLENAATHINDIYGFLNPTNGHDLSEKKGRVEKLTDYRNVFQENILKFPEIADLSRNDHTFGYSFVGGQNPFKLQKFETFPSHIRLTPEQYAKLDSLVQKKFGIDNFKTAVANNRIYMVQFKEFEPFAGKEDTATFSMGRHLGGAPKYLNAPTALFISDFSVTGLFPLMIKTGHLFNAPICFQTDATLDQNNQLKSNAAWDFAKLVVIAAHNQYHEQIAHLAQTHFVMEAIAVGTRRKLPLEHPVHVLLEEHFKGTLNINNLAVTKLIQPQNYVDRLVATTYENTVTLVTDGRLNFNYSDNYFPNRLKIAGTDLQIPGDRDQKKCISYYPARDYGLKIWNAISAWMKSFVTGVYNKRDFNSDAKLLKDWANEIQTNGKLKGFGGVGGQINSPDELADMLTMAIFTGGPMHAMLNYAQLSDMIYLPVAPLSLYQAVPNSQAEFDQIDENFLKLALPPFDVALLQAHAMTLLGAVYHTNLGNYESKQFAKLLKDFPALASSLRAFKISLGEIENAINSKNAKILNDNEIIKNTGTDGIPKQFGRAYVHLLPSKVPQSINI